ncbi:hypothetical protein IAT38_007038 [Cryptococcus sp. DSM 104549]
MPRHSLQPLSRAFQPHRDGLRRHDEGMWGNLDRVQVLGEEDGHTGCVNALSWSDDGMILLSGSDDRRICMWQPDPSPDSFSPHALKIYDTIFTGHRANIFSAKFLPNSNTPTIVSCAGDKEVRVFDVMRLGRGESMWRPGRYELGPVGDSFRVLQCHQDRTKRIATENSPWMFLTVSEDGTVRQHDLRRPHICRSECPDALFHAPRGVDLYSLSVSTVTPHMFAVAGRGEFAYICDRRMLERQTPSWGPHIKSSGQVHCVRKLGLPNEEWERVTPSGRSLSFDRDRHISCVKMSPENSDEVAVAFMKHSTSLFSLYDDPGSASARQASSPPIVPPNNESTRPRDYAHSSPSSDSTSPFPALSESHTQPGTSRLHPDSSSTRSDMGTGSPSRKRRLSDRSTQHGAGEAPSSRQRTQSRSSGEENVIPESEVAEEDDGGDAEPPVGIGIPNMSARPRWTAADFLNETERELRTNLELESEMEMEMEMDMLGDNHLDDMRELEMEMDEQDDPEDDEDEYGEEFDGDDDLDDFGDPQSIMDLRFGGSSASHASADSYDGVEVLYPRRSFYGARNVETVKDCNFLGTRSDKICSGSDDGNFFVWDKDTGKLEGIWEGDGSVVNVMEQHPTLPLIAVSGIDDTVKMFAPIPIRPPMSFNRTRLQDTIISRNTRPATFQSNPVSGIEHAAVFRMLAMRASANSGGDDGWGGRDCPTQ